MRTDKEYLIQIIDQNLHVTETQKILKNFLVEASSSYANLIKAGFTVQRHPLGFLSISSKLSTSQTIRVHLWSKYFSWTQQPNFQIHDHVFSFESRIILGNLWNRKYDTKPPFSNNRSYALYEVSYRDSISALTPTNKDVCLTKTSTSLFQEGDKYKMEAGVLHRSKCLSDSGITLLTTQTDPSAKKATVIGKKGLRSIEFKRDLDIEREFSKNINFVLKDF